MKTPITDAATRYKWQESCPVEVVPLSVAKALELDRAALMEALAEISRREDIEYGVEQIAKDALSTARANFPERLTATCDQCHCDSHGEPHTCPYKTDIAGNYDSLCHCCPDCTKGCADEI